MKTDLVNDLKRKLKMAKENLENYKKEECWGNLSKHGYEQMGFYRGQVYELENIIKCLKRK